MGEQWCNFGPFRASVFRSHRLFENSPDSDILNYQFVLIIHDMANFMKHKSLCSLQIVTLRKWVLFDGCQVNRIKWTSTATARQISAFSQLIGANICVNLSATMRVSVSSCQWRGRMFVTATISFNDTITLIKFYPSNCELVTGIFHKDQSI